MPLKTKNTIVYGAGGSFGGAIPRANRGTTKFAGEPAP